MDLVLTSFRQSLCLYKKLIKGGDKREAMTKEKKPKLRILMTSNESPENFIFYFHY